MAEQSGTLESLTIELGLALYALEGVFTAPNAALLFAELGLDAAPDLTSDAAFTQKLDKAGQQAGKLLASIEAISKARDSGDDLALVQAVGQLFTAIEEVVTAFNDISNDFIRATSALPQAADLKAFALTLVGLLLGNAVVSYLEMAHPFLRRILFLLGIVEMTPATVTLADVSTTVVRKKLHLDRVTLLLSDPLGVMHETYGWGDNTFDGTALFPNVRDVFDTLIPVAATHASDEDGPADLDFFGFLVRVATDVTPPGLLGSLFYDLGEQFDFTLAELSDNCRVAIQIEGNFASGLTLHLLPPLKLQVQGVGNLVGAASLKVLGQSDAASGAFSIFGDGGGSGLQAMGASAGLIANLAGDAASGTVRADVGFEAEFVQGELVVSASEGDGFLASVLPPDGVHIPISAGVTFTSDQGFRFKGSTSLDATLPIGLSLGALRVPTAHLSLQTSPSGILVQVSLSVGVFIGPIDALIDGLGIAASVSFPDNGGNLGIADLSLGFKPPSGVGLLVDSAGVTGGGFLAYDDNKREYSGVLQLQYIDLALQAFGLITTQVASGEGFSLLALVDADFPPVQLGWGFTLNGVGGLLAVHRTASTDALHAALKAGQLSSILFPKNAISNAPAILGQLDTLFPTAPGRFLFGPMALIGWGTPQVLSAAIAVIVELPEPIQIILLARIEARLPDASNALVRINMDALGVLDLSQDELSFDAVLFDSKLVGFTLSGAMALRATWASQREFVLAIGGFSPQFTPPPGFPTLQRMTIDMPSGSISKLRMAAYLALTSNSIQFGATLDAMIGVAGFGLAGHLAFDALLQQHPFQFSADISGSVAITAGGDDIASVELDATLSGPAPYHLAGTFKLHVIFFDVHYSFNDTWGEDAPSAPEPSIDVGVLLRTALAQLDSWDAQLPDGVSPLVSLRSVRDATSILAHPLAQPGVHERVVPLGLAITRFGEAIPSGDTTFTIGALRLGGNAVGTQAIEDDFAPAQFFDLTDTQKLEGPSYEQHDAGVRMTAAPVTTGVPVAKTTAYETYYIDTPGATPRTDTGIVVPPPAKGDLSVLIGFGAVARAAAARSARRYQTPGNPIRVAEPAFVLADPTTLAPAPIVPAAGATFSAMRTLLAANPNLQVIATHELAAH